MKKTIEHDTKVNAVYVTIKEGKHGISDQLNYQNATIVIDKDKKGNVLGVEII